MDACFAPWKGWGIRRRRVYEDIPCQAHHLPSPGPAVRRRVSLDDGLCLAGYSYDGRAIVDCGAAHPDRLVTHIWTRNTGALSPLSLVGVLFRLTDRPERALHGTYRADDPDSPARSQQHASTRHYRHAGFRMGTLHL